MDIYWANLPISASIHDGLTGSPAAVVDDTGPVIPEVDIDIFFDKVFPRPKIVDNIREILAQLERGRWRAYNSRTRRWRAFKGRPARSEQHAGGVFKNLVSIANAISVAAEAFSDGEVPLTRFDQDPGRAPKSDWRSGESQPDGYFILRDSRSGQTAHWMDIVATGEYKRDEDDVRNIEDDSKKVLWNMHQTLRDDPCRRFTFGFTIEDHTMRIWFASRADILVSAPFDFMSAPLYLIRFFLVMFYSNNHELGWDQTMEFVPAARKTKAYYIITVVGKDEKTGEVKEVRYRTVKLLSNVGAESLRGRTTRVWKAHRWEDGKMVGAPMVLKDCWADSDHTREGDVVKRIKEDAKKVGDVVLDSMGTTPEQVLERSLPQVVLHGDVKGDRFDCTMSETDRTSVCDPNRWFVFHRTQEKLDTFDALCTKTNGLSAIYDRPRLNLKPVTHCPKSPYRIVFAEVCTVLYSIKYLPGVLDVLMELCFILRALHAAGWVHRDVSSGNVMVTGNNVVKLADFESAKKIEDSDVKFPDVQTGTAEFMSVEVEAMDYMFQYGPLFDKVLRLYPESEYSVQIHVPRGGGARHGVSGEGHKGNNRKDAQPNHRKEGQKRQEKTPWMYNPIHDLESVYWLFLFFITWHDIVVLPTTSCKPNRKKSTRSDCSDSDSASENSADVLNGYTLPQQYEESVDARTERINAWYRFGENLFVSRGSRHAVITLASPLENFLDDHPLHPAVRDMGTYLVMCRSMITSAYRVVEEDLEALGTSERRLHAADGLHQRLRESLLRAKKSIKQEEGWAVLIRDLATQEWKLQNQTGVRSVQQGEGEVALSEETATNTVFSTSRSRKRRRGSERQGVDEPAALTGTITNTVTTPIKRRRNR